MLSELRWPGRDALEEGMDVRTLEMDPATMGAMELLARPDVMAELSDWRGGQALGLRTQAMVVIELGIGPHHRAQGRPQLVRARRRRDRAILVERGVSRVSPPSPSRRSSSTPRTEVDLLNLGGERHLDEMYDLSKAFHEAWDLEDGETMAMVLRVIHAPPPVGAQHSPSPEPGFEPQIPQAVEHQRRQRQRTRERCKWPQWPSIAYKM